MKKLVLAVLVALSLTAATPVATADVDIPLCYPCDEAR